jgi:DNA primase
MPRYTADSKERVRDAVDMIDLVSARTELRRAGANSYQGLCPFHEERTPSFGIDPVKKVYHCFGCGAGGDVFRFVQETEGLDFQAALESLADRYGVELEAEDEDPRAAARRQRRERLYALLERAAAWYARVLWEAGEAAGARDYLASRGLEEDVLRRFRVGLAPDSWERMVERGRAAGFSDEELLAAGLAQRSRRGTLVDRFRGRLTFPLCDARGRVLGFGARALRPDDRPKYLNTAEGEIYHKGRALFGADLARAAASRERSVVLVEGYTDALALHQAGIENAVALMGTALTVEQVGELARLVGPEGVVHLALDADASGQEAMLRAAQVAAERTLRLDVVPLPSGTDPAELVGAEGADAVRARVAGAVPFARFRVERLLEEADLDSAAGRTQAFEAVRRVLAALDPTPEREELQRVAASRLRLGDRLIDLLVAPLPAGAPAPAASGGAADRRHGPRADPQRRALDRAEEVERTFLALCVAAPDAGRDALRRVDLDAHFTSGLLRRAAAHLRDHLAAPVDGLDPADAELQSLIAELALRADREPVSPATLNVQTRQLEVARLDREIAAARAEGRTDVSTLAKERTQVLEDLSAAMDEAMATRGAGPAA